MNPDIHIQKIQYAQEADWCAALMASSEPWITLGRSQEDALQLIQDPLREAYVTAVGNELVGFIIIVMQGAFIGYIQSIAIAPGWRNQGIGSQLLRFAEAQIFSQTPNVFICVSSFNPKAQRWYERLGYEIVGTLNDYIIPGQAEILLRKSIAPLNL